MRHIATLLAAPFVAPLVAVSLVVVAACGTEPSPSGSAAPAARAGSAQPARPIPDTSAAALAGELAEADRLGTWSGLAGHWQGQRVRWTVIRYRALCGAADDCHVAAFPIQRPAQHGWMPALSFAPGQYEALARQCGADEPCALTVEATLGELVASPELATRVRLADVRVVPGARRT